jgi:hypothetical protein
LKECEFDQEELLSTMDQQLMEAETKRRQQLLEVMSGQGGGDDHLKSRGRPRTKPQVDVEAKVLQFDFLKRLPNGTCGKKYAYECKACAWYWKCDGVFNLERLNDDAHQAFQYCYILLHRLLLKVY